MWYFFWTRCIVSLRQKIFWKNREIYGYQSRVCFDSGKKPRVATGSSDLSSHWPNMIPTMMDNGKPWLCLKNLYFNQHFVFVVPISSKNVKSGVLAAESPKELLSQSYRWMCLKNRSGTGNCFQTCRFPWTWACSSDGRTVEFDSIGRWFESTCAHYKGKWEKISN